MSIHGLILKVAELDTVSITCPGCGTEIVFKASMPQSLGIATNCPSCRSNLEAAGQCAAMYRTFYQHAVANKLPISFKVAISPAN